MKAISALLLTDNYAEAARVAEVPIRTLNLWLTQDDFQQKYAQALKEQEQAQRKLREKLTAEFIKRINEACLGAIDVLVAIAHDEAQPAASRVSAAGKIVQANMEIYVGGLESLARQVLEKNTIDAQPVWGDSDGKIQSIA